MGVCVGVGNITRGVYKVVKGSYQKWLQGLWYTGGGEDKEGKREDIKAKD